MNTFFTKSDKIQHIIKSVNLTKTLFVSSIIIGEADIGKKSLARYLLPNAPLVSGKNQAEVIQALEESDELIITDFEKLTNHSALDFTNKRILATANYMGNAQSIDEIFAFIYTMPSLAERPEDVLYLKTLFIAKARSILMLENDNFKSDTIPLNLSKNTKSLRKSIFMYLVKQTMGAKEIQEIIYHYIEKNLDGTDGYKEHLELYEVPLIEAGLHKFGSQLQLSHVLGINRNTLRKKIHEHNID